MSLEVSAENDGTVAGAQPRAESREFQILDVIEKLINDVRTNGTVNRLD